MRGSRVGSGVGQYQGMILFILEGSTLFGSGVRTFGEGSRVQGGVQELKSLRVRVLGVCGHGCGEGRGNV